jgi:hypothetical protein
VASEEQEFVSKRNGLGLEQCWEAFFGVESKYEYSPGPSCDAIASKLALGTLPKVPSADADAELYAGH